MVSKQTVQAAINTYVAGVESMDVERAFNAFAPDGAMHYPGAGRLQGDALREFGQHFFGALTNASLSMEQPFIVDNRAAATFTLRITAKNGRSVTAEGIDVFEISDDGKVQNVWAYYDPEPVNTALGA